MKNDSYIKSLSIENYKTIRSINLNPKKINLLIGKPNVGKSNFLEAISLLGGGFSKGSPNDHHSGKKNAFLGDLIRFTNYSDLFYFQDIKKDILVQSNIGYASLRYHGNAINAYELLIDTNMEILNELRSQTQYGIEQLRNIVFKEEARSNHVLNLQFKYYNVFSEGSMFHNYFVSYNSFYSPIKKYNFNKEFIQDGKYDNPFTSFLLPPNGDNLFSIINTSSQIREQIGSYFSEYNLDFLIDATSKKFEIQRRENSIVYKLNYSLIADTLQRLIFYIAAIESNENSVILLEEPEAHSFPPYVNELARIIQGSETNQFFISTHSPYLIQELLKYNDGETLGLFFMDYINHETVIKEIPSERFGEISQMSASLFFNLNKF